MQRILLICAFISSVSASDLTVRTLVAASAGLNRPRDICIAPDGSYFFIVDADNHLIRRYDMISTALSTVAGSISGYEDSQGTSAKFNVPYGIAMHPTGDYVLIADFNNYRIRYMSSDTYFVTTIAGSGAASSSSGIGTSAHINRPMGIAISPDGSFALICEYFAHKVSKLNLITTAVSTVAGGTMGSAGGVGTNAQFKYPSSVAISDNGAFAVVADTQNHILRHVDLSTASVSVYCGLSAGTTGNNNGACYSAARFNFPRGVAIVSDDVFVADQSNHVIRAIDDSVKYVARFAGYGSAGSADGALTSARFNEPFGIAVYRAAGYAIIADSGNNMIRYVMLVAAPTVAPTPLPTVSPTYKPTSYPTLKPTPVPTAKPSISPTSYPTAIPTFKPTSSPTQNPTLFPSTKPTFSPTGFPTVPPTSSPTSAPTAFPTYNPSAFPTPSPTSSPTRAPTAIPTAQPTLSPTTSPTRIPTFKPTYSPTASPTTNPTESPTVSPTASPTSPPTSKPTAKPTSAPTCPPTAPPTCTQTMHPTFDPTCVPTREPTAQPTMPPTNLPTRFPTFSPTSTPTCKPTSKPTFVPTKTPTHSPTFHPTPSPTRSPTSFPTHMPTTYPTNTPTLLPTAVPSTLPSSVPTAAPTSPPTSEPTGAPTSVPTSTPSGIPTYTPTSLPSSCPSSIPTSIPTSFPSAEPTSHPSCIPTSNPTSVPTSVPTTVPTSIPTSFPSSVPTSIPTTVPTSIPTSFPSSVPTSIPTTVPTFIPTSFPSSIPTSIPTTVPTSIPTSFPSSIPTSIPTSMPSLVPTSIPSAAPSAVPSSIPSGIPTALPTSLPSCIPSSFPTTLPSSVPTSVPSTLPSSLPTSIPTSLPSSVPTTVPTVIPTTIPTNSPTDAPSALPSSVPTSMPSSTPTSVPSSIPSAFPTSLPSGAPTSLPTAAPSATPTALPTSTPSSVPTTVPSSQPTSSPSAIPSIFPTSVPTTIPTAVPTVVPSSTPSAVPTALPSGIPSSSPTALPTSLPTAIPTCAPTSVPTGLPTAIPSAIPTAIPSAAPTLLPTACPTSAPSSRPTSLPTIVPSSWPSSVPTAVPTSLPSTIPTSVPSAVPTVIPSSLPSSVPSAQPTSVPTAIPSSIPTSIPTAVPTAVPTSSVTQNNLNLTRLSGIGFSIYGTPELLLGYSVSALGDINGDGIDDILIGAPYNNLIMKTAYVVYGRAVSNDDIYIDSFNHKNGFIIQGGEMNDALGHIACGVSDVNFDGINDFAISAPFSKGRGAVYVIYGKAGYRNNINLQAFKVSDGYKISGHEVNGRAGYGVTSVGDVNGDGSQDIIISLPLVNDNTGMSYLVYGRSDGLHANTNLESWNANMGVIFRGSMTRCQSGSQVVSVGDINGDSVPDFAIGEPLALADYSGALRVVLGCATSCYDSEITLGKSVYDGFSIYGDGWLARIGSTVSTAGDINGDGYDDILLGSSMMNNNDGAVYVIFGKAVLIDVFLASLLPSQGYMIRGASSSAFGLSVSGGLDFNHDGMPDLVIGLTKQSSVAILGNRRFGTLTRMSARDGFYMSFGGSTLTTKAIGDINGDGFQDYAISATTRNSAGVIHVIYDIYGTSPVVTHHPVIYPTAAPSISPTRIPTKYPTAQPTRRPTPIPTQQPTPLPTFRPTFRPTKAPSITFYPTTTPTRTPSQSPTRRPTLAPSSFPTTSPSPWPSGKPSDSPSFAPNISPWPTAPSPIPHPTTCPTVHPTYFPSSLSPTLSPSVSLSPKPSPGVYPTDPSSITSRPTPYAHTYLPTAQGTSPIPTNGEYVVLHVTSCADYHGSKINEQVIFSVKDCSLSFSGNGGRHIYTIHNAPRSTIAIKDFDIAIDVVDLRSYSGISWKKLNMTTGSVKIHLPDGCTVILLHYLPSDMTPKSFLFYESTIGEGLTVSAIEITAFVVVAICLIGFIRLVVRDNRDHKIAVVPST